MYRLVSWQSASVKRKNKEKLEFSLVLERLSPDEEGSICPECDRIRNLELVDVDVDDLFEIK